MGETEALVLRGLRVPGWTEVQRLSLDQHETRAVCVDHAIGASLLRAVAGVRNRRQPRVTVDEVRVDGKAVTRDVENGRLVSEACAPDRRGIGYVPAGRSLLPHLSVWENIVGADDLQAGGADALLDELASKLELYGALTLLPQDLLGPDEYLRVTLARAAFGEPSVRIVHLHPSVPLPVEDLKELLQRACVGHGPAPATLVITAQQTMCDAVGPVILHPDAGHRANGG